MYSKPKFTERISRTNTHPLFFDDNGNCVSDYFVEKKIDHWVREFESCFVALVTDLICERGGVFWDDFDGFLTNHQLDYEEEVDCNTYNRVLQLVDAINQLFEPEEV